MITAWGCTDVGCVREHNEDSILWDQNGPLFVVADGMGGELGGEHASQLAKETLRDYFARGGAEDGPQWPFGYIKERDLIQNRMVTAIKLANRNIRKAARQDAALEGMGSTLAALYVIGNIAVVGGVGDSRIYLYSSDALQQVTHDDTFVGGLLEAGSITEEEATRHPERHVLTEAVGVRDDITVQVTEFELLKGDRILMCSDGIHGVLDDDILQKALSVRQEPGATVKYLVSRARREGGPDNISCIVIDYNSGSGH